MNPKFAHALVSSRSLLFSERRLFKYWFATGFGLAVSIAAVIAGQWVQPAEWPSLIVAGVSAVLLPCAVLQFLMLIDTVRTYRAWCLLVAFVWVYDPRVALLVHIAAPMLHLAHVSYLRARFSVQDQGPIPAESDQAGSSGGPCL